MQKDFAGGYSKGAIPDKVSQREFMRLLRIRSTMNFVRWWDHKNGDSVSSDGFTNISF